MVNTIHHGLWVYFFARKTANHWLYVLGGVAPDFIYIINGAYLLLLMRTIDQTWQRAIFENNWVLQAAYFTHSMIIWLLFVFIAYVFHQKSLFPFAIGWLSHILIDVLTHHRDSYPILWPLLDVRFPSPISFWENPHYGREFAMANGILLAIAYIYYLREKTRL